MPSEIVKQTKNQFLTMKKYAFIFATVCLSAVANAQVDVDMSKFFTIPEKTVDILEPNTHQDGIVFIGDTRPDEKKADGQYKGMRAQLQKQNCILVYAMATPIRILLYSHGKKVK